jgi:hypothetical protein
MILGFPASSHWSGWLHMVVHGVGGRIRLCVRCKMGGFLITNPLSERVV